MTSLGDKWQALVMRGQQAWHGSPLPDFCAWWWRELRALLPARLVRFLERPHAWYLLQPEGTTLTLTAVGSTQILARIDTTQAADLQQETLREALAHVDRHDLRLALVLPPAHVLRKRLRLPAAARGNIRRVIGYEMDRQTPFRISEVCYDVRRLGRHADGQLDVELVAVPRGRLQPWLDAAAAANAGLDAVDVLDDDTRLGSNMLDATNRARRPNPRKCLNLALAAAAILLTAAGMGQYLHNRHVVAATMQRQADALHAQAQQVRQLRHRLHDRMGAAGFLQRKRETTPAVIDVLADVTTQLPDDTWLKRLGIQNTDISLQGQSPHATHVISDVADSNYLADPGLQGVIKTDPDTGKERFYLTANLVAPDATGKPATSASIATAGSTEPSGATPAATGSSGDDDAQTQRH